MKGVYSQLYMEYAVIKSTGQVLVHCPSLVIYGHVFQEEVKGKVDKTSLNLLIPHLRSYKDAVNYLPNQVYIGNFEPESMEDYTQPWWSQTKDDLKHKSKKIAQFGEIIPQDEFFAIMKIVDVFDLVWLNKNFTKNVSAKLKKHPILSIFNLQKLENGKDEEEIEQEIKENRALPLFDINGNITTLVGCIRNAHNKDPNLSALVILENIASKASASLALIYALENNKISKGSIDYIIECSEEAIGDAFQRGGGNLAKSIGEVVGCDNATGSDLRAFCAAPVYAILTAASHVSAGTFKEIAVTAGGSVPKLGMNYKRMLGKEIPILEDCLASVAFIVGRDDNLSPIIRHEISGRHTIVKKSSPQEIMEGLVTEPLSKLGKRIIDIDKFSGELHNPEITMAAGAGDVAKSN